MCLVRRERRTVSECTGDVLCAQGDCEGQGAGCMWGGGERGHVASPGEATGLSWCATSSTAGRCSTPFLLMCRIMLLMLW